MVATSLLLSGLALAQAPKDVGRAESGTRPANKSEASAVPSRSPLVVAIVVDQLASWVLAERLAGLPEDGGFARLRREGRYFREMAYGHAITETAPGHASLFTGLVPREHGIVANDIAGPVTEKGKVEYKKLSMLRDESKQMVTLDGCLLKGAGPSLRSLGGKGADDPAIKARLGASIFRQQYPDGFVAALSLKDRGSLFGAGDKADLTVWFAEKPEVTDEHSEACKLAKKHGAVVSWKEEGKKLGELADFVRSYAKKEKNDGRDGIQRVIEQPWLKSGSDYAGFIDAAHVAAAAAKPGAAFRALPASDSMLLDMAAWVVEHPAKDRPTFLSLSLSANDYIGHLWGPDSWESRDELVRLDRALAVFFKALDHLAHDRWSLVLTGDHGIVPVETDAERPRCGDNLKAQLATATPCRGNRMLSEELERITKSTFATVIRDWPKDGRAQQAIAGVVQPYIYLTTEARARLSDKQRGELGKALDRDLRKAFAGVASVVDARDAGRCAKAKPRGKDDLDTLVCDAINPTQDGDFYIVVKPGSFISPELVKGTDVTHGSPYGYDRFVPLFVKKAGRSEDRGTVMQERVPFTRFRDELLETIRLSASKRD